MYRPNAGLGESSVGRWLGVSHKVGQLMSYWVLTISGHVVLCTDMQRLTQLEQQKPEYQSLMKEFDTTIGKAFDTKDYDLTAKTVETDLWNMLSVDQFDDEFAKDMARVINNEDLPHAKDDLEQSHEVDPYLNIELGLPRGTDGELHHATVKQRRVDENGNPIGSPHKNPILDSREYDVEFLDGTVETLTANIIAENLLAQVDEEGHRQLLLDEIIDFRKDSSAVPKGNDTIVTRNGITCKRMTTRGWELCVI